MKKQEIVIRVQIEADAPRRAYTVKGKGVTAKRRPKHRPIKQSVYKDIIGLGVGSSIDIGEEAERLGLSAKKLQKRINSATWYYRKKDNIPRAYTVLKAESGPGIYATRVR